MAEVCGVGFPCADTPQRVHSGSGSVGHKYGTLTTVPPDGGAVVVARLPDMICMLASVSRLSSIPLKTSDILCAVFQCRMFSAIFEY